MHNDGNKYFAHSQLHTIQLFTLYTHIDIIIILLYMYYSVRLLITMNEYWRHIVRIEFSRVQKWLLVICYEICNHLKAFCIYASLAYGHCWFQSLCGEKVAIRRNLMNLPDVGECVMRSFCTLSPPPHRLSYILSMLADSSM